MWEGEPKADRLENEISPRSLESAEIHVRLFEGTTVRVIKEMEQDLDVDVTVYPGCRWLSTAARDLVAPRLLGSEYRCDFDFLRILIVERHLAVRQGHTACFTATHQKQRQEPSYGSESQGHLRPGAYGYKSGSQNSKAIAESETYHPLL